VKGGEKIGRPSHDGGKKFLKVEKSPVPEFGSGVGGVRGEEERGRDGGG